MRNNLPAERAAKSAKPLAQGQEGVMAKRACGVGRISKRSTCGIGRFPAVWCPSPPRVMKITDNPSVTDADAFSSGHVQGVNFLFGDGSVQSISSAISTAVYDALATRDAGDAVDRVPIDLWDGESFCASQPLRTGAAARRQGSPWTLGTTMLFSPSPLRIVDPRAGGLAIRLPPDRNISRLTHDTISLTRLSLHARPRGSSKLCAKRRNAKATDPRR
jgi:prepilin-type processing-associated H-X9-DG protein